MIVHTPMVRMMPVRFRSWDFGVIPNVYDGRSQDRPIVVPGESAAKVPVGYTSRGWGDAHISQCAEPTASYPSKHAKDERVGEGTIHRLIWRGIAHCNDRFPRGEGEQASVGNTCDGAVPLLQPPSITDRCCE